MANTSDPDVGASWADYDGDGDDDMYICVDNNFNHLFRNDGNGVFTEITSHVLVNYSNRSQTSAWADYDNDGDLDVFMCNHAVSNQLFRNDGNGNFTEITSGSLVTDGGDSQEGCWGDLDNDGYLDLFVTNRYGQDNFLYRNNGNGTFTRILAGPLVTGGGDSHGASWCDYDNDGDLDLFVANEGSKNHLFRNDGGMNFTKITTGDIVNDVADWINAEWGDYTNDGFFDLLVTSYNGNLDKLYRNNGNGTFTSIATGALVTTSTFAHSSGWIDVNNDGLLDVLIFNSHASQPNSCKNRFYLNTGGGNFQVVTSENIVDDALISSAASFGDYDGDGFVDVFSLSSTGNNVLYHNNGNSNHWFKLRLQGVLSNRSGIGAQIRVFASIGTQPVWQMRQVETGGTFWGQGSLTAEFGLGDASVIDSLIIHWPSGQVCRYAGFPVDVDTLLVENCDATPIPEPSNSEPRHALMELHPNPSTGSFTVKTKSLSDFTLHDVYGRLLFHGKTNNMHSLNLPDGIYMVTCTSRTGRQTKRLVIQN